MKQKKLSEKSQKLASLIKIPTLCKQALPRLLSYEAKAYDDEAIVRAKKAAQSLHNLLNHMPIHWYPKLERHVRKNRTHIGVDLMRLKYLLEKINFEPPILFSILAALTFDSDGYIRETALINCIRINPTLSIPLIIIRANDWVPQIRKIAAYTLEKQLTPLNSRNILAAMPILAELYHQKRTDHSLLLNKIQQHLIKHYFDDILLMIKDENHAIARVAFDFALPNTAAIATTLEAARKSNDVMVRLNAIKTINTQPNNDFSFKYLSDSLQEKAYLVRKQALYVMIKKHPQKCLKILTEALFDEKRSIRQIARFYLIKNESHNIQSVYLQALRNNDYPTHICIQGLAEVGDKNTFVYIRPYIQSTNSHIIQSVIYATLKLKPNDLSILIEKLMKTNDKRVHIIINQYLQDNPDIKILALVDTYLQTCLNDEIITLYYLTILKHKNAWEKLDFMLILVENITQNELLTNMIEKKIEGWINHHSPNKTFLRHQKSSSFILQLRQRINKILARRNHIDLYHRLTYKLIEFID